MDRYRVMFLDGSVEKVSADSATQAKEKAIMFRKEEGLSGASIRATSVLKG